MLSNLTIKWKLILSTSISILSLVVMVIFMNQSISSISQLEKAEKKLIELRADMKTLRIIERSFLLNNNSNEKQKFNKSLAILKKDSKILFDLLEQNNISTSSLKEFDKIIDAYNVCFLKVFSKQKIIGFSQTEGLYGTLRKEASNIQNIVIDIKYYKLLSAIYELRKHEKDFILRREQKYIDKALTVISRINKNVSKNQKSFTKEQKVKVLNSLKEYKKAFISLTNTEKELGLKRTDGLNGKMVRTIDKTTVIIKDLVKSLNNEVEKLKSSKNTQISIISFIIMIIISILAIIIGKSIFKSLKSLEVATDELRKTGKASNRIDITNNDEIAQISKNINQYLDGIEEGIKDDMRFINDTQSVMAKVSKGWIFDHIKADTKNPALIELKTTVNEALSSLEHKFKLLNKILEEYTRLDYRNKLQLEDIEKGGLFDNLINDINSLQSTITKMLIENKANGMTLEQSSTVLLNNVDNLNKNSNEAAAALEETAAALEDITSNISNNTNTVIGMAEQGKELKSAVAKGQKLANETTVAMDDIDKEVSAINESITVIDQIAFQTNIVSLNAAVEAATAGEAGKGFAVVAQEVRNLATRSADAANEIKILVTNAIEKANRGKSISNDMTDGYTSLNNSITKTLTMISDVEMASKEQKVGIEQINDSISQLDQQTQQNANIASQTQCVAHQTDKIAKLVVSDANEKEFNGKDTTKAKHMEDCETQI